MQTAHPVTPMVDRVAKRAELLAHLERATEWLCECGERGNACSSKWRFNGKDWEHHHGYPMGHVEAAHSPATVPAEPAL